jgi:hypothetical protein
MKQRIECEYPKCGQTKHGARHEGFSADHDFQPPARDGFGSRGSTLRSRSERPNRVERREEVSQARQQAHAGPRYCVAPAHGIESPCGIGPDATLEASHTVGLGMGGGKEHGEIVLLCRAHHRELDSNRQAFRDAGLSKRAPVPDKVPPRPSSTPRAEAPPAPSQAAQRRPRSRL